MSPRSPSARSLRASCSAAARPGPRRGRAVPAVALKAALAYTGGKAGPANNSLSPIYVGWVSDETAITGHAGNTDGVIAAENLINKNLGGIDGHPLKIVSCPITSTDAQGATCAQLFLNRSNIPVVAEGELLTGESSFIGTMNGQKPVISIFTHGKGNDPNTFYLDGAIQGQLASVTYLANIVHAKNVAILGPDLPGVSSALAMFKGLFATLGVSSTVVTYPNAATDLTAAIAASGAESADGIFVVGSTADECIALGQAFKQLLLNSQAGRLAARVPGAVGQAGARRLPEVDVRVHRQEPGRSVREERPDGRLHRRDEQLQQPGQRAGRLLRR